MSTISASTTSTTGFKVTSDTTGTLVFQTGASPTTAMSISSSQIISFTNPPTATGGGGVSTNTSYGTSALAANTTGGANTGIGYQALLANTTAQGLTAVGAGALSGSNTGSYNNAFGSSVLAANTSGTENNGFGFWTLISNTTGSDNSAFGEETLRANTTGSYNTAYGAYALRFNTTASNNTAVGYQALYSNTTGQYNVAVGTTAGYSNTTTSFNTFVGHNAGYTSNYTADAYGGNTMIGANAGRSTTTGKENVFVGKDAGYSNTTGTRNTFVGAYYEGVGGSGYFVTTGSKNTILGAYNGNQGSLDIRTASNNIVLSDGDGNPRAYWNSSGGMLSGTTSLPGGASNVIAGPVNLWAFCALNTSTVSTGYGSLAKLSFSPNDISSLFFGGEDTTTGRFYVRSNGGVANYSANNVNLSDSREKTNVSPAGNYLAKICAIPVRTYNYIDQNLEEDDGLTLGVFAQDVQAVAPELVNESNWAKAGDEPKMRLSIYQTDLQYALMKCIQEQQAIIETLTNRITALEAK